MNIAQDNRIRALEIRCEALENRVRELEEAATRPPEPPPAFLNPKSTVSLPKKG